MTSPTAFLHLANEQILEDIKRELRLQGHYLTGALEASLTSMVSTAEGDLSGWATAAAYIEQLEHPTPAAQVSVSPAEFDGLKRWVLLRGLASYDAEATRVAAAIVSKWKKEGRPTAGSLQYSKTGKRTDAIRDVFRENELRYDDLVTDSAEAGLDHEFLKTKSGEV